ncbi:MAG TPA: diguanylate cyclase [Thiobacillaceae bacterium]|nr:diguanylate cyclase [Thiobacillaceae bacterium]
METLTATAANRFPRYAPTRMDGTCRRVWDMHPTSPAPGRRKDPFGVSRLIGPILALLLLAGSPSLAAQPMQKVRLQLKWQHQFQFAGYYAALEQGFYREAGLEVEILEGRAHESAVDVVSRGEAEYGVHGADLVVERARGRPVRALAAIFQHSPMVLLARRDSQIDSLHDLANKRLLLGPDAAELVAYLRREGVPYQVIRQEQSFDLRALLAGAVDAMPAYSTDQVFLLKQAQLPYSLFTPRSAGIDFYGDVLFSSENELKRHPQRLRRFVEASLRGWYYALSHQEELARLIHTRYSQRHSLEHLLFEAEQIRQLMSPELVDIGHMSPGRWRHIADTFAELDMMPANFILDDFFLPPGGVHQDYTRYYLMIGTVFLALVLAVWVSLHFSRMNRALRREVAERQRLYEDLERLANTDALTGLPNRRSFLDQLGSELARRQRYGHPLSLLILDMDHFKRINDQWGHTVGDEVLRQFARTLRQCLRGQDTPGRLGGEEFAVFLPETSEEVALTVAERIRARTRDMAFATPQGECHATVSIGLTQAQDSDDMESLLHRADKAMYTAKADGRDRVVSSGRQVLDT